MRCMLHSTEHHSADCHSTHEQCLHGMWRLVPSGAIPWCAANVSARSQRAELFSASHDRKHSLQGWCDASSWCAAAAQWQQQTSRGTTPHQQRRHTGASTRCFYVQASAGGTWPNGLSSRRGFPCGVQQHIVTGSCQAGLAAFQRTVNHNLNVWPMYGVHCSLAQGA